MGSGSRYGFMPGATLISSRADGTGSQSIMNFETAVTFTRKGFVPRTIPVQIEPTQPGVSDAKFAPDPIFAALQPLPAPEAKSKPARSAVTSVAPPRDAHEEIPSDGFLSRSWKYLEQKRQNWQKGLAKLLHVDAFR